MGSADNAALRVPFARPVDEAFCQLPFVSFDGGLGDWHKGQLPDERMREATKNRGIILTSRAQKFQPEFFDKFDLILVADHKVMKELYQHAEKPDHKAKMHFITHFSANYKDQEVPDPYYQSGSGFEHVLDMLEDSIDGILNHIRG